MSTNPGLPYMRFPDVSNNPGLPYMRFPDVSTKPGLPYMRFPDVLTNPGLLFMHTTRLLPIIPLALTTVLLFQCQCCTDCILALLLILIDVCALVVWFCRCSFPSVLRPDMERNLAIVIRPCQHTPVFVCITITIGPPDTHYLGSNLCICIEKTDATAVPPLVTSRGLRPTRCTRTSFCDIQFLSSSAVFPVGVFGSPNLMQKFKKCGLQLK